MKKRTRLLIVGLMAIAVTGASTFAYFAKTSPISGNENGGELKLDITNGNVEVTGVIGEGGKTPNWTYDVADGASDKDRSPDIYLDGVNKGWENENGDPNGEGTTSDSAEDKSIKRVTIGTKVKGKISYARPGDAFVLGGAASNDKKGLVITNNSKLTVKVNVGLKEDTTNTVDGKEYVTVIKALQDAGWKLYINGEDTNAEKSTIEDALKKSSLTLTPSSTNTISIRLEFPLTQGNAYENLSNVQGDTSFDIRKLFEIKATQENNPGWKEDGTI